MQPIHSLEEIYSHPGPNGVQCVAYYVDEEFRQHPGNSRYLVSNRGMVFDQKLQRFAAQRSVPPSYKPVYPKINNSTYKQMTINGKATLIHRLIMETFGPMYPIPPGIQVNHMDGVKWNNVYFGPNDPRTNLELCTNEENRKHAAKMDLIPKGENHRRSLFTNQEVHKFCQLMAQGYSAKMIADECGIAFTPQFSKNICDIRNGRSYSHISEHYPNLNAHISGNRVRIKDETLHQICSLLSQGKSAPEIAAALGWPYDGNRLPAIIQYIKTGSSNPIVSQYSFPYKKRGTS